MRSLVRNSLTHSANTASPKIELLAIVETLKEFKGMLWGQQITVFTDHANLIRGALGLTLDRVHQWRLLLEAYEPEIVYIKGIHNTVADTVLRLEYDPSPEKKDKSMSAPLTKFCTQAVDPHQCLLFFYT